MAQISYQNKSNINTTTTPVQNKISDADMNEIKSVVNNNTPIGVISIYAGSTAPTGWLICDGSAVSRTTYSNLFNLIGTTYGNGDGTNTFNLPNLKGKVVVGIDSNDADFDTLGATGGEKEHTLVIQELPSHSHEEKYGTAKWVDSGGEGSTALGNKTSYDGGATEKANITSETGGNEAHNNLQPYLVMNYIISY